MISLSTFFFLSQRDISLQKYRTPSCPTLPYIELLWQQQVPIKTRKYEVEPFSHFLFQVHKDHVNKVIAKVKAHCINNPTPTFFVSTAYQGATHVSLEDWPNYHY